MNVQTREWTSSTGETRYYVQNVADLIGLDIDYYGTGNIRSAALDGARLSNRRAAEILAVKVWIGTDNLVHADGPAALRGPISKQEIAVAVKAAWVKQMGL